MNTIAKVSEDTLKIETFFTQQSPGGFVSYEDIEKSTGVRMSVKGKAYMRSALNRLKIEYTVVPGSGIELASKDNGMKIISGRLRKINGTVKRANKCHRRIQDQFFDAMSPEAQRQVLFVGSIFGAIRLAAENGRHIYGPKTGTPKSIGLSIPVPEMFAKNHDLT